MLQHLAKTILPVMLLTGCATTQLYQGEKQPLESIVIIKGMSNLDISAGGYASKICEFDNQQLDTCQPSIEFLPGPHKLVLESSHYGLPHNQETVEKEFQAGERYILGVGGSKSYHTSPVLLFIGKYNKETGQIDKQENP